MNVLPTLAQQPPNINEIIKIILIQLGKVAWAAAEPILAGEF